MLQRRVNGLLKILKISARSSTGCHGSILTKYKSIIVVVVAAHLSAQLIGRSDHPTKSGMVDGCTLTDQGPFAPQGLEQIQPDTYVCILMAGVKTDHIAFTEQGRQIASDSAIPVTICSNQHVGQPWMHRQSGHLSASIGNPGIKIQGTEGSQKTAGAAKRVPGRPTRARAKDRGTCLTNATWVLAVMCWLPPRARPAQHGCVGRPALRARPSR